MKIAVMSLTRAGRAAFFCAIARRIFEREDDDTMTTELSIFAFPPEFREFRFGRGELILRLLH